MELKKDPNYFAGFYANYSKKNRSRGGGGKAKSNKILKRATNRNKVRWARSEIDEVQHPLQPGVLPHLFVGGDAQWGDAGPGATAALDGHLIAAEGVDDAADFHLAELVAVPLDIQEDGVAAHPLAVAPSQGFYH